MRTVTSMQPATKLRTLVPDVARWLEPIVMMLVYSAAYPALCFGEGRSALVYRLVGIWEVEVERER
jgi:hypothetical protein